MTGSKKAGAGANGCKVATPKAPMSNNKRKSNGEKKNDNGQAADDGDKGDEETPTKKTKVNPTSGKQAVANGVVGDGERAGE